MTFANSFVLGNLQVTVSNICGSSAPTQLALSLTNTFAVGTISGPTDVCSYIGSAVNYSVASVPGASTYSWTAPAGCSILSGNGTNSVQISYPNGFITGTVSVAVASYCGSGSTSQSLAVSTIPSDPGSINGVACVTLGNSNAYNISPVVGATSYSWTVPSGASIISGQGTTSITVSYPNSVSFGFVSARGINNCSGGSTRSRQIKLQSCPSSFTSTEPTSKTVAAATEEMTVSVYPNPTTTEFRINLNTRSSEVVKVRVMDMQGRMVKAYTLAASQQMTFGNDLKAGSYMVEFIQGDKKKVQRLIKF
jgi:hypothetical protein